MEDLIAARRVAVQDSSQAAEARRESGLFAARLGFDDIQTGQLAIVVTELATNLLKHGGGGEILLCPVERRGSTTLAVLAIDKGPGVSNVSECLVDGYSTVGSAGTGLGAITRQSADFEIYSQPQAGTVACAQFTEEPKSSDGRVWIGGLSVPVTGETVCGDAWAVVERPEGPLLMMADGLGHGPLAYEASHIAVAVFHERPDLSLTEQMERLHQALRPTRGAALAIASFDLTRGQLRFCGIGNIAGALVSGSSSQHFVSMNGTVGHHMRQPREFTYSLPSGASVVMHSDGLGGRWDLNSYPGLTLRPPTLVAGVLYRDHVRGRDDATVVIARLRE